MAIGLVTYGLFGFSWICWQENDCSMITKMKSQYTLITISWINYVQIEVSPFKLKIDFLIACDVHCFKTFSWSTINIFNTHKFWIFYTVLVIFFFVYRPAMNKHRHWPSYSSAHGPHLVVIPLRTIELCWNKTGVNNINVMTD